MSDAAFWKWFGEHADRLAVDFEDASLWLELARCLKAVDPNLAFEFGLDADQQWWIAIGPGGDFQHLGTAARLVDAAPAGLQWNVRIGRQRRAWTDALLVLQAGFPDLPWTRLDPAAWRWALQSQLPTGHWSAFSVVPPSRHLPGPVPTVSGAQQQPAETAPTGGQQGLPTPGAAARTNRLRMAISAPDLSACAAVSRAECERILRFLVTSLIGELAVLRWFDAFVLVDPDRTPSFLVSSRPMTVLAADWDRRPAAAPR